MHEPGVRSNPVSHFAELDRVSSARGARAPNTKETNMPVSEPQAHGATEASNTTEGEEHRLLRLKLGMLERELATLRDRLDVLWVYREIEIARRRALLQILLGERCVGQGGNKGGRPKTRSNISPAEVEAMAQMLGGLGATARELGCSVGSVHGYVRGKRGMPVELAAKLRQIVALEEARIAGKAEGCGALSQPVPRFEEPPAPLAARPSTLLTSEGWFSTSISQHSSGALARGGGVEDFGGVATFPPYELSE
jgi:hypothetical protein